MFNEDSQIPEKLQGHDESLRNPAIEANGAPSERSTDRFGLESSGKGYLLRKYIVTTSAAGNPYFQPIGSVLKALQADAAAVLAQARSVHKSDEERVDRAETQALKGLEYFEAINEAAGEERSWVGKKRVIWPLTDDLGYQLYKAASAIDDLADFAQYLIRTDANIQSFADAQADERYEKRKFWSDLALAEAGEIDDIIQTIDGDTEYNLEWMMREGYRSAAMQDTRNHLNGVRENAPVDGDAPDIKAQMKQQLLDATAA